MIEKIKLKFIEFSKDKYASNVIETCLRNHIVIDLTGTDVFDSLGDLLFHKYGNYVFQTMLTKSKGPFRERLITLVVSQLDSLKADNRGSKIL